MGTKHTPTPWGVVQNLRPATVGVRLNANSNKWLFQALSDDEMSSDDAVFMVKAVNNHDALVSALRDLADAARNACNAEQHPALTNALFEADQIIKAAE